LAVVVLLQNGEIRITKERILSLVEADYDSLSKLRLPGVPKAMAFMNAPVMPMLRKDNLGFPRWPEPIRDRNKIFRLDPEMK